jgi:hypothetical protein
MFCEKQRDFVADSMRSASFALIYEYWYPTPIGQYENDSIESHSVSLGTSVFKLNLLDGDEASAL